MDTPIPTARYWCHKGRRYLPAADVAVTGTGHLLVRTPDYVPTRDGWCDAGLAGYDLVAERATTLTDGAGRVLYEGDLVVTENDHANGGREGFDHWVAADWGIALVTIGLLGEARLATKDGDVWSTRDEESVYHTAFSRVIGNLRETPELWAAEEGAQ